jgi:hypothetical protein
MFSRNSMRSVCAGIGMALTASMALAATVTTRGDMGGNDHIDWAQIPAGAAIGNSASVASFGGLTATVSNPGGLRRADQTGCGGTYPANFAPCDATIFGDSLFARPNAVTVSFDSPVAGGGAQFASAVYLGPVTFTIVAFDAAGFILEGYALDGVTTGAADNSAPFLGILRPQADIARLEFGALPYTVPNTGVFEAVGINRVELATSPIPEPAAAWLLMLGLPLAAWAAQRGRRPQA